MADYENEVYMPMLGIGQVLFLDYKKKFLQALKTFLVGKEGEMNINVLIGSFKPVEYLPTPGMLVSFKGQTSICRMRKLMYRVVFPFDLKLRNTTDDCMDADQSYSLFAVVVHVGSGPNHGKPFFSS